MSGAGAERPARVVPLTDEHLRAALPSSRTPADECPICRAIGGRVSRLEKVGYPAQGTIPEAVGRLQEFMRLGEQVATTWLERCPACDALYYVERSYEFLIGGSEDYESYTRITPDEVLELPEVSWARSDRGAELHWHADGTIYIIREPGTHSPQRRA
jgi:hypothetical protein